jgi:hypothetical protein
MRLRFAVRPTTRVKGKPEVQLTDGDLLGMSKPGEELIYLAPGILCNTFRPAPI